MPRVVIMRHGESRYNALKKYAGWLDCDLTPEGVSQAKKAGQVLRDHGFCFDVAFTSLLRRAVDTLRHTLDEMGQRDVSVHQSWSLNERHFGALDDLTREEAEGKFGAETLRRCREDFRFPPPPSTNMETSYPGDMPSGQTAPRSESMLDATTRCAAYWNDIVVPAVGAGKSVLVVSHGDILRMLTGYLLRMSEGDIVRSRVLANAAPTVLDLDDDLNVKGQHELLRVELKEPV